MKLPDYKACLTSQSQFYRLKNSPPPGQLPKIPMNKSLLCWLESKIYAL